MKLSYRGVSYEHSPSTLEVTEGEILGKYRGIGWHCHTLKEMPVPQPNMALKYRGVAYNTNPAAATTGSCNVRVTAANVASAVARPVVASKVLNKELEAVHRFNLQRNLERRLQVARERGDLALINLLEAESRQLV